MIGTVDRSHIPIIAPPLDPTSYYCRKGYYSALFQGVVDARCRFWDYDFGWAGRCHCGTKSPLQGTWAQMGRKMVWVN